jgi:hypothetical protein
MLVDNAVEDLSGLPSGTHKLLNTLHFGGVSNQGCAEVPQQTWTHLGLSRKMPGIKSCYDTALKT